MSVLHTLAWTGQPLFEIPGKVKAQKNWREDEKNKTKHENMKEQLAENLLVHCKVSALEI